MTLTESQEGVFLQLEVRLRHLQVHLQQKGLLECKSEVRLLLPNAASHIVEVWQGLDQRNSTQRMVLIDGGEGVVDLKGKRGLIRSGGGRV
ncbi:MAG: hypothetical protein ACMG6E_10470 [Candidatus Roizmanbacteria bacterium]